VSNRPPKTNSTYYPLTEKLLVSWQMSTQAQQSSVSLSYPTQVQAISFRHNPFIAPLFQQLHCSHTTT